MTAGQRRRCFGLLRFSGHRDLVAAASIATRESPAPKARIHNAHRKLGER
ncbi:hypothetical protein [Micromonospora kangleipakensis]|nr:hypothetical protein [Micromonospora kangleipakensis]